MSKIYQPVALSLRIRVKVMRKRMRTKSKKKRTLVSKRMMITEKQVVQVGRIAKVELPR